MNNWKAKIITAMPEIFPGSLEKSIIGKSLKNNIWSLEVVNLRDYSHDQRGSIDDSPFGGGPGMIIRPDVVEKAIKKSTENVENKLPLVYMTPAGRPLNQQIIKKYSNESGVIILCGRYEGVDERVLEAYDFDRISVGDYILPGGESAAIIFIEACVRLLPNVLGEKQSLEVESFVDDLLEYPQYTRPDIWVDENNIQYKVPDVLLSGNHKNISKWRKEKSIEKTKKFRPDLLNKKFKTE